MVTRVTKKLSVRPRRKTPMLKHYFVPGAHNAYRPLFLRIESIAINVLVIVLLLFVAIGIEWFVIRNPSPQVSAVVTSVLVGLANDDRALEGYPELSVSSKLMEAAQMKADDMAGRGYFAHNSPLGFDPWHWFKEAGYDFRYAGENLAVYFSDSAEIEKAWMNSPLHRANILSENFTEIGIAIAHGVYEGHETTYVVQMFGKPSDIPAASIVSSSLDEEGSGTVAGVSAEAQPIGAIKGFPSGTIWRILTAPRTTLQYTYTGIAILVLLSIGLLFLVEMRRLHTPSLLRGVGVLVLIGLLFYGSTLISGELLIL